MGWQQGWIYFEDAFHLLGNSSVTDDKKLKKRPSTKTNKMIFVKKKLENLSKQADKFDEDMTKSFNLKWASFENKRQGRQITGTSLRERERDPGSQRTRKFAPTANDKHKQVRDWERRQAD